jgi:dienelactone hydrolase
MLRFVTCLLTVSLIAGCSAAKVAPKDTSRTMVASTGVSPLVEARRGFQSKLINRGGQRSPVPKPPAELFQLVRYSSSVGELQAFLTPDPGDGKKLPAIIWITGGDCNSIDSVWDEMPPDNDQTAKAYREVGIVMMFPSLRGGNNNPGRKEGFLGEVEDILAARDFLATQPHVDPRRIYLGGHSTGGTLVLLTAECSDKFRAVFSFGPVSHVSGYPPEFTPFDTRNSQETRLRSPIYWLHAIRSTVFVFEGENDGNGESLQAMSEAAKNPHAKFLLVRGGNHFNILAPVNRLVAQKILSDTGPTCNLAITSEDLGQAMRQR